MQEKKIVVYAGPEYDLVGELDITNMSMDTQEEIVIGYGLLFEARIVFEDEWRICRVIDGESTTLQLN